MMLQNDTIAAIATGLSDSGIGIIRISGSDAVEICHKVFFSASGKRILNQMKSHLMQYGFVRDENDCIIDEVMAVVMKAPRSFTGEDTVEIQCHGGVLVMKKILNCVCRAGARLAEPGEFTKRAFLNGRIDLSRAEAVMDVIHSQNEYALKSSVNQLRGSIEKKVKELRAKLIYEIAFIESALDDPEHISLEGYADKLYREIEGISDEIKKMIDSADDGMMIKNGINTVILGKPNAGKSSLMNRILGRERAIVTDIAGTTRDTLQETISMNGINLNVIDTAGIRNSEDVVERIGVDRAIESAENADLILYVIDSSESLDESNRTIFSKIGNKKCIVLLNKTDLEIKVSEKEIENLLKENHSDFNHYKIIRTSMTENTGISNLQDTITKMFFKGDIKMNDEIVISNERHKEAFVKAYDSLSLVKKSIEAEMPEDFLSIDLMDAYGYLGRIIGEEIDDDLIEEIFSKFCMGK